MSAPVRGLRPEWDSEPWRIMLCCYDAPTCTHRDHIRWAKKAWREAIAGDLAFFADALHERHCSIWTERHHGGALAARSVALCGPDRHIAAIAALPHVVELHARHGANHVPQEGLF